MFLHKSEMRLAVLLLPLVAAKPLFTYENIERLDVQWAFDAAEDVVNYFEDDKTQQSIWQQIKDDEKYSKLVKILKVGLSETGLGVMMRDLRLGGCARWRQIWARSRNATRRLTLV